MRIGQLLFVRFNLRQCDLEQYQRIPSWFLNNKYMFLSFWRVKLAVGYDIIIWKFLLHQCLLNLHEEVHDREFFQPLVGWTWSCGVWIIVLSLLLLWVLCISLTSIHVHIHGCIYMCNYINSTIFCPSVISYFLEYRGCLSINPWAFALYANSS